ncbi:host cell division inhibitor Icd-like protein [Yersinia enterocolitica]|nr:host cell division inhibitor Icd-like protein [Yersinia enterocolitica]
MMPITQAATLNRLSLSESDTNPVISGQLQKILQVTFGYLQTVPAISVLFKGGNSNAQNLNYETFVGTSKSNLHQSPEFNGDCYSAKYSAQQTPLKNGNSPSLPVRRNLLIKLNCAETGQLANSLILSRNAQSVCREIKGEKYSCSVKPENYSGSAVIQHGCNNENQQVKSKEKGSTVNATLWDYSDGSVLDFLRWRRLISLCATSTMALIFSPAFVPISSIRASASSAPLRLDSNLFSSLSLSWRRAISSCIAVTIKPALLSPSIFTASIPSITSCGMRMDICFDLSLTVFVAMFSTLNKTCDSVYMKSNHTKHLMCDSFNCNLNHTLSTDKAQAVHKITKPSSALTLTGPLTTNDRLSIEVAMLNHTQTRPKYQYLFLAVCRSDLNAKPHRESVTAHSEQDARRSLASQFVLSFAGRIPAQGVCNA